MKESVDLIENNDFKNASGTKNRIRRDILKIFTKWSKEPLTAKRIYQLLEEEGCSIKMDTLYDNLETLVKKSILKKTSLPPNGKRKRPSCEYKLRNEAIYELFSLTEDLIDAMGFGQLAQTNDPSKTAVIKFAIKRGKEFRSLRTPPESGELTQVARLATEEDLEKTWRLDQHITELRNYCSTDSPAYKEYELKKDWEFSRSTKGLNGEYLLDERVSLEDFRDGFRKAMESESGVIRTKAGIFGVCKPGKPAIEFKFVGPICLEERSPNLDGPRQHNILSKAPNLGECPHLAECRESPRVLFWKDGTGEDGFNCETCDVGKKFRKRAIMPIDKMDKE